MPANRKVVYTSGVPVVADFAATDGAPLCVDVLTGTVYYLASGDVVTPISAGGAGTVTSVNLTAPTTLFTVAGTPVTSTGTIAISFVSATANLVLATPNGSTGNPSLRALVDADVPNALTINGGTVNNTVVGGSTAAAGTFTTLSATATATFSNLVNISATSAGQIQFPATQNSSSDANTLDDYEEGTWTPSVGGTATYTLQDGRYTKIGRIVWIQCGLVISSIGTGSTQQISGLPFTNTGTLASVFTARFSSLAHSVVFLGAYSDASSTYIRFTELTAAGASVTTDAAVMGSGTVIQFTGVYGV